MDDPTSPDRIPLDRTPERPPERLGERPGGDRPPVPRFNALPDLPELPDLPRGAIPPTPSIPIPAPLPPSLPPGLPAPRVMVDLPRPSPTVSVEPPRPAPPKPQPAAATPPPATPPAPQGRWVGEALGMLLRPTRSKATVLAAAGSLVAGAFGLQVLVGRTATTATAPTTKETAADPHSQPKPAATPADEPSTPSEPPFFAAGDERSGEAPEPLAIRTGVDGFPALPKAAPPGPPPPAGFPKVPTLPAPAAPVAVRDHNIQPAHHEVPTIPGMSAADPPAIPGVLPPSAPVAAPVTPAPTIPTVAAPTTVPAPVTVPMIPAAPAAPEPIKVAPVNPEPAKVPPPMPEPVKVTLPPGVGEMPKALEVPKPIEPKPVEAPAAKPPEPAPVKLVDLPSPKPAPPPSEGLKLPGAVAPPALTSALNGTNTGGGFVVQPEPAAAPPAIPTPVTPAPTTPVVPTLPPPVPKAGFGGLDAPPVPALAAIPGPAAPKPAGDARTDFDVDLHPAQAGQTYEAISKQHYQDAKYAEALRAFNKNRDPGRDEVQLPPTHVLRKLASGRAPATPSPIAPAGGESWAPAATASNSRPAPAGRTYTVPQDGMSFRDIAGELLNDRAKYNRISNLNPNLDANARLKKGDTITVP